MQSLKQALDEAKPPCFGEFEEIGTNTKRVNYGKKKHINKSC